MTVLRGRTDERKGETLSRWTDDRGKQTRQTSEGDGERRGGGGGNRLKRGRERQGEGVGETDRQREA